MSSGWFSPDCAAQTLAPVWWLKPVYASHYFMPLSVSHQAHDAMCLECENRAKILHQKKEFFYSNTWSHLLMWSWCDQFTRLNECSHHLARDGELLERQRQWLIWTCWHPGWHIYNSIRRWSDRLGISAYVVRDFSVTSMLFPGSNDVLHLGVTRGCCSLVKIAGLGPYLDIVFLSLIITKLTQDQQNHTTLHSTTTAPASLLLIAVKAQNTWFWNKCVR